MTDLLDLATRVLSTTAGRWRTLVETTTDELFHRVPAPGEWSAADCLTHLLVAERDVFGFRLRAILEGRDLVSFDPNAAQDAAARAEATPREMVAALASERDANLAILRTLAEADLDRTARHPEYGPVPLRVVLNSWAAHDLQHTVQAEEAMMQAFLPGTGPFRFRFAAHDVSPPG